MAMIATNIKGMLSISIKSRHDSHTDQYNRIVMVKLMMVSSFIMGISWFQDSITCIVPDSHTMSPPFVSSACWIQGVYVFKELQHETNNIAYFGVPKDIESDGILDAVSSKTKLHLCQTNKRLESTYSEICRPMIKTFFLQYQWMPFVIAVMAMLYYLPYIAFRATNTDLISLKDTVKGQNPDAEKIAKHYFNYHINPTHKMMARIFFNILVEILYIMANLMTFLGLDQLLNGDFVGYGSKWIKWTQLNNTIAFDYMGKRNFPKPGDFLLPPFGYCEVYESAKDVKQTVVNKHKFVCELSQNILYQYVLIVLWFAIVIGLIVSVVGLVLLVVHYALGIFGIRQNSLAFKDVLKMLSFREMEYLEFIRKRNPVLCRQVLHKLREIINNQNKSVVVMEDDNLLKQPRSSDVPTYPELS